ncbi:LamG-like jellyroll fold domain-containing protein [Acinetobacter sp. BSP-28]|uniref:LamG-like jellyroll fold domain-containing protein n=1 Tax=Acinetobacter sp. BSP-28 TaxID=3344661 RepID=UPI00376FF8E4
MTVESGIRLEFAQFGHFDSFDIIRSLTSMVGLVDNAHPTPIVTGLKTMYYVDQEVIEGTRYYYKVRVWRGSTSFISNEVTIIADADNYWTNVSSLLHFDGANNSTIFTDQKGTVWNRSGNPVISTAQSKFGGSSGRFTDNNYIYTNNNAGFLFGVTEDFTIEAWLYVPTGASIYENVLPIICAGFQDLSSGGGGWNLAVVDKANATISLQRCGTNLTIQTAEFTIGSALARDVWHHIEFGRAAGTTYGFFNGNLKGTTTIQNNIPFNSPNTSNVSIGSGNGRVLPNNWHLDGYVDDLRVTKGVCRHTANFAVPTRPHPDA